MTAGTYTRYAEYDIATMIPLFWEDVPWDGEWAEAKKGREAQAGITDTARQNAATDQATRTAQLTAMNPDLQALDVKPGQLSSAAQSRLGQDLARINTTYNNAGQVGLKAIAQRGMGGPSGAASSLNNSLLMQRARDENAAYDAAQQESHGDMLAAIGARSGLQQIYNPNQSLQTGAQSALNQSQMGSTLGDIGKGLTTAAALGIGLPV